MDTQVSCERGAWSSLGPGVLDAPPTGSSTDTLSPGTVTLTRPCASVDSAAADRVYLVLADGASSCRCDAKGDGSTPSGPCGACSSVMVASDGSGGTPPAIGSISLDNSTAQIGSVMNYITVVMPDKDHRAAKPARPEGVNITGVAIKAVALAAKDKLSALRSNDRDGLVPESRMPPRCRLCPSMVISALVALATLLAVYLVLLARKQAVAAPDDVDGILTLPNGVRTADRRFWGARPPRREMPLLITPAKYVVVHHTATDPCQYPEQCAGMVRSFQDYHQKPRPQGRGWDDIGYNFLVGGDGVVYVGRGWDSVSGHFDDTVWNQTMNLAVIGNYVQAVPPSGQRDTLRKFIEWGMQMGKIRPDYLLLGACQIKNTQSPGLRFMDDLRSWWHWWDHLDNPEYCKQ